jgi:hypothetical protein
MRGYYVKERSLARGKKVTNIQGVPKTLDKRGIESIWQEP